MTRTERLQHHFSTRLKSYEVHALVQASMAERLAAELAARLRLREPAHVLELGCGGGGFTKRLLSVVSTGVYWRNDLFDPGDVFRQQVPLHKSKEWKDLWGDAEALEWPRELDVVCSNAAVQWFQSPASVLPKAWAALQPGGLLAVTTFLPGHYREFTQTTGVGLNYLDRSAWELALQTDWDVLGQWEQEQTLVFANPREVLRHVQKTGVGAVEDRPWSRSRWQAFHRDYPRLADGTCPLSYVGLGFVAQKPRSAS